MRHSEPDYDAEMRLAPGVTCDDCAHASRCFGFGFSTPGRTSCDFWPSRFRTPSERTAPADDREDGQDGQHKMNSHESSVADKRTPSGRLATQCKSEGGEG